MATIADLLIKLGVQDDGAAAGFQKVGTEAEAAGAKAEGFGTKVGEAKESVIGSVGKIVAAAGLMSGAFEAGEFLKGSIESAENLTKAQDGLSLAIDHTGGNVTKLRPELDAVAKSAADFGINQVTATQGLQKATLIAGSAEAGLRAYREAMLISKATGQDFNAVLLATSKGQQGITTSLQRYGIAVKAGTSGQDQLNMVMKTFGGQAEANTTESEKLRARFENFQATLGQKLLPLFDKFIVILGDAGTWLSDTAKWLQKNQDIVLPLAAAIGAITAAIMAWKVATAIWTAVTEAATAAQEALNLALESNPIGLVILALVGLGAALVVLWNRSTTFRNIVTGAFNAIKAVALPVFEAIKSDGTTAFNAIKTVATEVFSALAPIIRVYEKAIRVEIGVFAAIFDAIPGAIRVIKSVASAVFGAIAGIISTAKKAVQAEVNTFKSIFQAILDVLHAVEDAANAAASAVSKVASVASKIKGGASSVLSHIPGFATGVSNFQGGYAVVGENGPELAYLPGGTDVYTNSQSRRMLAGAGAGNVTVENMNVRSDEDVRLWARDLARRLGG